MKMVIEGANKLNVVVESTIKHCHLKVEPQSHPFRVAWVNKANFTITHRCKVPI